MLWAQFNFPRRTITNQCVSLNSRREHTLAHPGFEVRTSWYQRRVSQAFSFVFSFCNPRNVLFTNVFLLINSIYISVYLYLTNAVRPIMLDLRSSTIPAPKSEINGFYRDGPNVLRKFLNSGCDIFSH